MTIDRKSERQADITSYTGDLADLDVTALSVIELESRLELSVAVAALDCPVDLCGVNQSGGGCHMHTCECNGATICDTDYCNSNECQP